MAACVFPRLWPKSTWRKRREILTAFHGGINYYDTAYIYPGSEAALGEILEKNSIREQVYIASKLPHYLVREEAGLDKIFTEELERLRTDHINYYLMHMLTDIQSWERLKALGIEDWLREKKKSGAIRQVRFSYHGNTDMFCRLVDAYDWDFYQIQYNYMDEHSQAGRKGLLYANEKGLPAIIMEPLRGGKLVKRLPEEAKRIFTEYPIQHSPAEWAFRWLWAQPEVTCVLSGMNSDAMIRENIQAASTVEIGELGPREQEILRQVSAAINAKTKVACTGCCYCMPCPKQVDIPATFAAYNRRFVEGQFWALVNYFMCTALRKTSTAASNCIECGKCEKYCPQNIAIRKELKTARKELEGHINKLSQRILKLLKAF